MNNRARIHSPGLMSSSQPNPLHCVPTHQLLPGVVVSREITRRRDAEELGCKQRKQLSTLYLIAEQMMNAVDVPVLMRYVVYSVFQTLGVTSVLVCELCNSGRSLIVRDGIGLPNRYFNRASPREISPLSLPGRSLAANRPIHLSSDACAHWLDGMDYLSAGSAGSAESVESGVASVLADSEGAFGLVMAFHGAANDFSAEDIDYIHSLSNLLSIAGGSHPAAARSKLDQAAACRS